MGSCLAFGVIWTLCGFSTSIWRSPVFFECSRGSLTHSGAPCGSLSALWDSLGLSGVSFKLSSGSLGPSGGSVGPLWVFSRCSLGALWPPCVLSECSVSLWVLPGCSLSLQVLCECSVASQNALWELSACSMSLWVLSEGFIKLYYKVVLLSFIIQLY